MRPQQIAFFVNNLDEEYQISIYRAVREAAIEQHYRLICIQSETIFRNELRGRPFYSAPWLSVEGILLLSSVIGAEFKKEDKKYLEGTFDSIPLVSIGRQFFDFPSILIRSKKAFSSLLRHLIEDHKYRSFLYIGGPIHHHDNIIREQIVQDVIKEYRQQGLFLELTIEHGLFHEYSSMVITTRYLNERPAHPFDVIITANDNMAIGVLKAIETSKNPYWKSCAITGFDDIPLAALEHPSLTTIHQPLDELGRRAVELLDHIIKKENYPTIQFVESSLILRESCGCHVETNTSHLVPTPIFGALQGYTSLPHRLVLNHQKPFTENDSSLLVYLSIKSEQYLRNLSYLGQRLITISTYHGMVQHLSDFLTALSVPLCYLFVFPNPQKEAPPQALLLYKKSQGKEENLGEHPPLVIIQEVLQEEEAPVQCVYPLRSGDNYVGILVYYAEDYAQPHLCSCATFLANNLERLHELEREKQRAQILEEEVQLRTQELVKAYEELQAESRRREAVEAEVLRISELERLRFSLDLHDDICQRLAGLSMYCKSMLPQYPGLQDVIQMIDETLMLTRQYAHDAFPVELENLGLEKALENLCATMERQVGCTYNFFWNIPSDMTRLSKSQAINVYLSLIHI
ncbi:MAG: substrate-binding domain-containing protein, partial [Treponemataceae bacterium]|nr:substrate-binding domain-containing protein [Treponemataceae bacterium]